MIDLFDTKYFWILSGITTGSTGLTWITSKYEEPFQNVTDMRENNFNYQKCWSGVCYNYINQLANVYKKEYMVGNPNYIRNFYNEFVVIDTCMKNFNYVDIVVDKELDISSRYTKLDNVLLKSNHRILLINQEDSTKNGIYKISSTGFLTIDTDLNDTGKTYMYSCYAKNGSYKDKQMFLMNSGDTSYFPIESEEKEFIQNRSYILKNKFFYNIFQTGTTSDIVPKLIFTDYEMIRKSFKNIANLYDGIIIGSITDIKYYINSTDYILYTINSISDNGNPISEIINWSGHTRVVSGSFSDDDYVTITIKNGDDILLMYRTYIHKVDGTDVFLSFNIPSEIIEELKILYPSATYNIEKDVSDLETIINNNEMPFSNLFYYTGGTLFPDNDEYVDYDAFDIDGSSFQTDSIYAKYKLYEHLNLVNSSVYTTTFNIKNSSSSEDTLTVTWSGYTGHDINKNYLLASHIILSASTTDLAKFQEYTYADINSDSNLRTLVTEITDEYIKIEIPISFENVDYYLDSDAVTSLRTTYKLQTASNILYDVYKNNNYGYYRKQPDNIKRKICGGYGELLSQNINIITGTTGIILQNEDDNFEFRLFNIENPYLTLSSGSTTMDKNLLYIPVDLLKVGYDKKTRFQLPIWNNNIQITS